MAGSQKVSKKTVLAYARKIKAARPDISADELRALLTAKFVHDKDVFDLAPRVYAGAIANPLDWFAGLGKIFSGLAKLFGERPDLTGVEDIIEGVIIIVSEEGA